MICIIPATDIALDDIYNLIQKVGVSMRGSDWFAFSKRKEVYKYFLSCGYSYIAVDTSENTIVGLLLTCVSVVDMDGLYRELNYTLGDISETIIADTCVVHKDYRGMGIMSQLLTRFLSSLEGTRFKRVICTVHPDNKYSLSNVLSLGFEERVRTKLYGGKDRIILERMLR